MTINVQRDILTHSDPGTNRVSTYTLSEDAGLRVRVKNPGGTNVDQMTYSERIELARFLVSGLSVGGDYRLADFADGVGGLNERADRLAYTNSFGLWASTADATDLWTWINHEDSSRLDGDWDERVRTYYKERGY